MYLRDERFLTVMAHVKGNVSWSPVDVDVEARSMEVAVVALSPTQIFVGFLGAHGHSDLYNLNVGNRPVDMRPTVFGAQLQTRLSYVFATNRGFIIICRGMGMDGVMLLKHMLSSKHNFVHLQFREYPSQAVAVDDRFEFVRVT